MVLLFLTLLKRLYFKHRYYLYLSTYNILYSLKSNGVYNAKFIRFKAPI